MALLSATGDSGRPESCTTVASMAAMPDSASAKWPCDGPSTEIVIAPRPSRQV